MSLLAKGPFSLEESHRHFVGDQRLKNGVLRQREYDKAISVAPSAEMEGSGF